MHKQRYGAPSLLQNHPNQQEFPIQKLDKEREPEHYHDPISMYFVGFFMLASIISVIMLLLLAIIHFTNLLSWSSESFYSIAKPIWWSTLALFILMIIRLITQLNPAKKEQKQYYKLTKTGWLSREKREGLRLDLFSMYESGFWSETLEYYPLQWRIEATKPEALKQFQILNLASTQTYINNLEHWWDITSTSSLKFMLEKLLKGLHAPEFATSLPNYPYLTKTLSDNTGFSIAGIESTLKPKGDFPPEWIWAFDLSRAVSVARNGFMAQYLTEEEAWHYILRAKNRAYEIFQSEEAFFDNYMLGYAYWQSDSKACQERMLAYHQYRQECRWPMKRLRWNHRYYVKPEPLNTGISNTSRIEMSDLIR